MARSSLQTKYVVVSFEEGADPPEVAVGNTLWLHDFTGPNHCETYWPPTRSSERVNRLIRADTPPDPETWTSFPVKILYRTHNNVKAKKRCLRATEETDVDYSSEDSPINTRKKKKRRPNVRYQESPSSSEADEFPGMTRAPKAKRSSKSSVPAFPHPSENLVFPGPSTSRSRTPPPVPSTPACRPASTPNATPSTPDVTPSAPTSRPSTPRSRPSTQSSTPPGSPVRTTEDRAANYEIRHLHVKMEEIQSELRENRKLLRAILDKLKNSSAEETTDFPEGLPSLPVDQVDSVELLNEALQEDAKGRKQMTSYLRRCGGTTVRDTVNRIMLTVMDPSVATKFNWKGQRGSKKGFSGLKPLLGVVFDAVRGNSHTSSATLTEVEDAVKNFLKYAYQRLPKPTPSPESPVADSDDDPLTIKTRPFTIKQESCVVLV